MNSISRALDLDFRPGYNPGMSTAIPALRAIHLVILTFFCFQAVTAAPVAARAAAMPATEGSYFRVRIGLYNLGFPREFVIQPSNNCLEIFDPNGRVAVFSGRCARATVVAFPGGVAVYDGKKPIARSPRPLLFSAIGRSPSHIDVGASKSLRAYRGTIAIAPCQGRLFAVNVIDMEEYLKSVVPAEIGDECPEASFEAQAIAARSYALRNLNRHDPSGFDLCDRVHCQAYPGMVSEVSKAAHAVQRTLGEVLLFDGQFANTVYHARCGGKLSSSQSVWGGKNLSYLPSHEDSLGNNGYFCNLTPEEIRAGVNERNTKPKPGLLAIPRHRRFIRASRGHRVGMCQDGAIGMGLAGYAKGQILGFYYPGTRLALMRYARRRNIPRETKPTVALNNPEAPPAMRTALGAKSSQTVRKTLSEIGPKVVDKPKTSLTGAKKWYWSSIPPRNSTKEAWIPARPSEREETTQALSDKSSETPPQAG